MTREERLAYMRDYFGQRKARGACTDCGKAHAGPQCRCFACRLKRAERKRQRRAA